MNPSPQARPARLADARVSPPVVVPATLARGFPGARLAEVEAAWAPARGELAVALRTAGLDLESSHWDWTRKSPRVTSGELLLLAVECEGSVQGLMALASEHRQSTLTPGSSVLYIDYLEAAPWNQRAASRPPRYLGVGSVLLAEALMLSAELGLGGRLGLHSLPQAERFYEANCRMRRVGPDPNYYDLTYFEYDGASASAWLAARNTG